MTPQNAIIRSLSDVFQLTAARHEHFPQQLADAINYLVENDFPRLTQILYRMDISESLLKRMVGTNTDEDAGLIIARLLIERERQKIETRERFKRDDDIPENERW